MNPTRAPDLLWIWPPSLGKTDKTTIKGGVDNRSAGEMWVGPFLGWWRGSPLLSLLLQNTGWRGNHDGFGGYGGFWSGLLTTLKLIAPLCRQMSLFFCFFDCFCVSGHVWPWQATGISGVSWFCPLDLLTFLQLNVPLFSSSSVKFISGVENRPGPI